MFDKSLHSVLHEENIIFNQVPKIIQRDNQLVLSPHCQYKLSKIEIDPSPPPCLVPRPFLLWRTKCGLARSTVHSGPETRISFGVTHMADDEDDEGDDDDDEVARIGGHQGRCILVRSQLL